MVHLLPPLLGLLSFLVINVGGFILMASGHVKGLRVRRFSDGTATAQDVSEATRLIRERADRMMSGIFQQLRSGRREEVD
jgi:hypothetical protein